MTLRRVSQAELIRQLGFGKNQIHYWLKGKSEPSIDDLIKLARFFDVSIDCLIGYNSGDQT